MSIEERISPPACPVCGAESRYRRWKTTNAGNRGSLKVLSDAHRFLGSDTQALVCLRCGYVQLFVNPEDFSHERSLL